MISIATRENETPKLHLIKRFKESNENDFFCLIFSICVTMFCKHNFWFILLFEQKKKTKQKNKTKTKKEKKRKEKRKMIENTLN